MWEERERAAGVRFQVLPCTREPQAPPSNSEWAEAPGLSHLRLKGSGVRGRQCWVRSLTAGSHAGSPGPHISERKACR